MPLTTTIQAPSCNQEFWGLDEQMVELHWIPMIFMYFAFVRNGRIRKGEFDIHRAWVKEFSLSKPFISMTFTCLNQSRRVCWLENLLKVVDSLSPFFRYATSIQITVWPFQPCDSALHIYTCLIKPILLHKLCIYQVKRKYSSVGIPIMHTKQMPANSPFSLSIYGLTCIFSHNHREAISLFFLWSYRTWEKKAATSYQYEHTHYHNSTLFYSAVSTFSTQIIYHLIALMLLRLTKSIRKMCR